MKASKTIEYGSLILSLINGRKVSTLVLDKVRLEAGIKDFTTTKEKIVVESSLARITLRDTIKIAEVLGQTELCKKAEDAAAEGDAKNAMLYETLIDHEKSRSKWRGKFHLKSGDTELFIRLLFRFFGAVG